MKAKNYFMRYTLSIFLLFNASNLLWSQFSIGGGYGYGLPLAAQEFQVFYENKQNGESISQLRGGSFAEGLYQNLELGYSFNGITASCIVTNFEGRENSSIEKFPHSNSEAATSQKSKMLLISPNIKLLHHHQHWSYFVRFGGNIGINGKIEERKDIVSTVIIQDEKKTTKRSIADGNIYYGITAGTGIGYRLWRGLRLELELFYNNGSYSPNRWRLVEYTKNGVDLLETLPVVEKETIISDGYFIKENSVFNPDEPRKAYRGYSTYSVVGLKLGIRYEFGTKQ